MTKTLLREPDELEEAEFNYSNFDHEMPEHADTLLRNGKHRMEHTAWDHWGAVWFAEGQFHERVMRYLVHVATVSGPTLDDVIREVNQTYGQD